MRSGFRHSGTSGRVTSRGGSEKGLLGRIPGRREGELGAGSDLAFGAVALFAELELGL
jgi:hypothetical protein